MKYALSNNKLPVLTLKLSEYSNETSTMKHASFVPENF